MTIDSDDEDLPPPKVSRHAVSQNVDPEDAQLNAEFTFDLTGDPYVDILGDHSRDLVKTGSRPVSIFKSTLNVPFHHLFLPRNLSLSTTSSRDANCRRILGSVNETSNPRRRMN